MSPITIWCRNDKELVTHVRWEYAPTEEELDAFNSTGLLNVDAKCKASGKVMTVCFRRTTKIPKNTRMT